MPATLREVLKTHTFEQQRQIINTLAEDFYDYTLGEGGISSFLSLVDGNVNDPALFFDSERSLGLYKSSTGTLSVASTDTQIFDFSPLNVSSYKNYIVKNSLISSTNIDSAGSYYRPGIFTTGLSSNRSGYGGQLSVVVSAFSANITNGGSGYPAGLISNVTISGGTGTGGKANLTVAGIQGSITNGGSGYPATIPYVNVPLQGGSGTGATAAIVVNASGQISSVTISSSGTGYLNGDQLTVNNADLSYFDQFGNPQTSSGSGFIFTITNTPYRVTNVVPSSTWNGSGYTIGDVCGVTGTTSGSGLSFTMTQVGYISAVSSISNGGYSYSVGEIVSPRALKAQQDQWSGIINTYTYNVEVRDIGGGVNRYYINLNDGNGFQLHPNLVFERDALYNFIFTNPNDYLTHPLKFSRIADGIHNPNAGSNSGYDTNVHNLTFIGSGIQIYVNENAPSTLYYYCDVHPNMSGADGNEASISVSSRYGFGAQIEVTATTSQDSIILNQDGTISSGSITLDGVLSVSQNVVIDGQLNVAGSSVLDSLDVTNALTAGTLTINDSFNVTGSTVIGESLVVNTDQLVVDHESGFIGINASAFIEDPITNPLQYSLELYGSLYNNGNAILAESPSSYLNIGDIQGNSKLNVAGNTEISGNLSVSQNISIGNPLSLSEPSLYFTDNRKVGLYYNAAEDFISITGYTGELSSYKYDSLHFYRDSNFTARNVDEYIINSGSGYTDGNYTNVELVGGTGNGLIADITVAFVTKATEPGEGYTSGEYTNVPLSGGSGTGAVADITISSGNIANNIQITNPGSGYEDVPTVTFIDSSGSGAIAVANLSSSGNVKNILLNTFGSNYTSAPTVIIGTEWSASQTVEIGQQYFYGSNLYTVISQGTFDATTPPSHTSGSAFNGTVELEYAGVVAEATAVLGTQVGIDDDEIDYITISNTGSGYTVNPQISIVGGGGSGATAIAVLGFTIESVSVLDGGENYTLPTVVFTGGGESTIAQATASVTNQGVSKVVVTNPGSGYNIGDTLSFSQNDLLDTNTGTTSVAPSTVASLEITSLGAVTVVNITDFGFGYEANDSIVFDSTVAPGNTGGSEFSINIISTIEENIVNIDLQNSLLTSVGIKTLSGGININDNISLSSTGISKSTSGNLLLSATDFVQVSGSKALIVPSGTTAQRPGNTLAGAIRYNTSESRFEGYNGSFFVSLGGVRDVDGNTYISAELNPGDNDNTLRFVNDDVQSMQVEQNKITLQSISNLDVTNINGIPEWVAGESVTAPSDPINDPPVLIYYEDRVYSVDSTGTFDLSNPPLHTSGTETNGNVDLSYVRSIYGALSFTGTNLNLSLDKINFNSNALTIFGSSTTSTTLSTEAPEILLSFGSISDPLLKLNNSGSIFVNTGFGATQNYIKLLDYQLNEFNLKDTKIFSSTGSIDTSQGNSVNITFVEYDVNTSSLPLHSGKLMVEITDDSVPARRQYTEISFLVKSDLSDILYTENNKIYTNVELCDVSVGIDGSNNLTVDVVDLTSSVSTLYTIKVVSQAILV